MTELMSKKEFLMRCPHEELVIMLMNREAHEEDLQNRLFLLSGCGEFGRSDGTVGSCVECSVDRPDQWARCQAFGRMMDEYEKEKRRTQCG